MALLFTFSFALTVYAYFGYPVLLAVYARLRPRPWSGDAITPSVSIVMAVRNEQERLPAKLQNLLSLDYPPEKMQIIVVSDGSGDRSPEILQEHASKIVPVILPHAVGKAAALNAAVRHAAGDILVLCDVRQSIDLDAVRKLAFCFADEQVGAASGELHLESAPGEPAGDALGLYWKIEKVVRKLESQTGSLVGMTGALCALRRELYVELPQGTLLDDVLIPMNVVRQGRRVVFQPEAIVRDHIFPETKKEFRRKVRTLTGNYQLLSLAPWLLTPGNPLLLRFISHKLLRLAVPLLLVLMLVSSGLGGTWWLHTAFVLQLVFYGLAALGLLSRSLRKVKPIGIAYTFLSLNTAAVLALRNAFLREEKTWG